MDGGRGAHTEDDTRGKYIYVRLKQNGCKSKSPTMYE